MDTSTVYISRDNPLDWVLVSTSPTGTTTYVDADSFTRFVLEMNDTITLDSDDLGIGVDKVFDLSISVLIGLLTVSVLRLRLGLAELSAGTYKARLVGYNTDWPDGLVWQDKISLKVVA